MSGSEPTLGGGSPAQETTEFLLRAGDGLYIPRGWPHQARAAPAPHPEAHTRQTRQTRQTRATPGASDPNPDPDPNLVPTLNPNLDPNLDPDLDPNLDPNLDPMCASAAGSAHLTLAVEVEPPFDWEGALH
eukprot:470496-Pyramimonas_sp.AAC.1